MLQSKSKKSRNSTTKIELEISENIVSFLSPFCFSRDFLEYLVAQGIRLTKKQNF